jgi:transposase
MLTDMGVDVKEPTMAADEPYTLSSEHLGALPVINFFLARMGVAEHLATYLPADDARLRLTPAAVIALVVRNIVAGHRPVYALGEWATPYDPAVLGLRPGDAEALNDDRVGRMLDRLFDADRASLITATVLGVIRDFGVDVSQLHNDSTTVTVTGNYPAADGRARGGTATPAIHHGHNKDYRPDLKQLLFILTVSADGAVPIAYRVADGNTNDDVTHIPTWDELHALVGRADFLYVADSKLCSAQAMGHINSHGGRFVTVVPHGRREDTWFRDWAQTHAPAWAEAHRSPGARLEDPDRIWRTFEAPAPSVDGYRVIWVHSSMKAANDAQTRAGRIEAGLAAVDAVAARLAGPKTRLKTKVAAEAAATTALTAAGATRWVGFTITETTDVTYHQERRGRPGSQTRYRRSEKPALTITAAIRADNVAYDAVTDGCFPIITNDTTMTPADVFAAYRYQPNLERRNHLLKGPQEVAPVYLETAHRIEALLLCHFLAMLTEALIEREIRTSMHTEGLTGIPLYPELRNCPAPSAPRILEIFNELQRHHLQARDQTVQTFQPQLTPLHQQVLDLLHIPASAYSPTDAP